MTLTAKMLGVGHFHDRLVPVRRASIVDDNVDAAEGLDCGAGGALDVLAARDVGVSAIAPPPKRLAAASATSLLRSRQATRAPSRAKTSAMPKPNPCPAPVTSAVFAF